MLRAVTVKNDKQDEAPDRATLTAVVRGFVPVEPVELVWEFPFWRAPNDRDPIDPLGEKLTTVTYAQKYASEKWESRATVERKAHDDRVSVRESRALFEGAIAEGHLIERQEKHGRAVRKLYRLTDRDPFLDDSSAKPSNN